MTISLRARLILLFVSILLFIPILGILLCLMLMFSLPWQNWLRLFVWLAIGFVIYFGYGMKHSVMHKYNLAHPEGWTPATETTPKSD